MSNMWLIFVTQYNSSLSSFVPNFRILTQVVAEKSLTEKKFTDTQTNGQTNKHNYRKGNIYIPPIYFVLGGIKTDITGLDNTFQKFVVTLFISKIIDKHFCLFLFDLILYARVNNFSFMLGRVFLG